RVAVRVYGLDGAVVSQTPSAAAVERSLRSADFRGAAFFVDRPLADADGAPLGRVTAAVWARYDFHKSLLFRAFFFARAWPVMLFAALVVGLICGLAAARYVNRRLRAIDRASRRWAEGAFTHRIAADGDDELSEHSRRLDAMAAQLQTVVRLRQTIAVSEERDRVSRELHDTVKQKLFALSLQIAVVKNKAEAGQPAPAAALDEASALTAEAQRDLMTILTELQPPAQPEMSLKQSLERIAAEFNRRFTAARVGMGPFLDLALGPRDAENVMSIAQEAMVNAIRHGAAARITLSLTRAGDGAAALTIVDDGCGFDPSETARGLGLRSMAERAAQLPAGSVSVRSSPGGGATVTLCWREEEDHD
ncbi:MAG: sensor histidine kinase, partial [Pseudomonadota bacterium]